MESSTETELGIEYEDLLGRNLAHFLIKKATRCP